jgi:hypothetical protein
MESDFLKNCRRLTGSERKPTVVWTVYEKVQEGGKAISKLCVAADASRAGCYRVIKPVRAVDKEMSFET